MAALWSGWRSVVHAGGIPAQPLLTVVIVQSDRYWTFYILFPVWMILSSLVFNDPRAEARRVRAGSRVREMLLTVRHCSGSALLYATLPLLAGVVMLVGAQGRIPALSTEAITSWPHTVALIAGQWGKTAVALVLLTAVIHSVQYLIVSLPWRVAALVAVWLVILLSASTTAWWSTTSLWLVDPYRSSWPIAVATTTIPLMLLIALLGLWRWRDLPNRARCVVDARRVAVVLCGAALIVLSARQGTEPGAPLALALHRAFVGGAAGGLSIVSMATYGLLNVLPALFLGFTVSEDFRRRSPALAVRWGSMRSLGTRLAVRSASLGVEIAVGTTAVVCGASLAFGGRPTLPDAALFGVFAVATVLQVIVLTVLLACTAVLADDLRVVHLVGLGALVLSLPALNPIRLLPFGLNLTRGSAASDMLTGVLCLSVWALACFIVIHVALHQPRSSRWIMERM